MFSFLFFEFGFSYWGRLVLLMLSLWVPVLFWTLGVTSMKDFEKDEIGTFDWVVHMSILIIQCWMAYHLMPQMGFTRGWQDLLATLFLALPNIALALCGFISAMKTVNVGKKASELIVGGMFIHALFVSIVIIERAP